MKKRLFNDNWKFAKIDSGNSIFDFSEDEINWYNVELPHDWLIYDTSTLEQVSNGWYKKIFNIKNCKNKKTRIYFDGICKNSEVYINKKEVGKWRYGYSSFEYDITPYLIDGNNEIIVRSSSEFPSERWYSGSGIFRNVYLIESQYSHFMSDGIYISANSQNGSVYISAEVKSTSLNSLKEYSLRLSIIDNKKNVAEKFIDHNYIKFHHNQEIISFECEVQVNNPKLWDLKNAICYKMHATLFQKGILIDYVNVKFGFRSVEFKPDEGFYLNGKYMKIKGVCLHHDLGMLGAAVNSSAIKRQLKIMKKMGVNAIRTVHNMPAIEIMDMCDELGLLVMSEAFDVWKLGKNTYDYSRYFEKDCEKDIKSWVRRDRNHPSLVLWSIGNEIIDTHVDSKAIETAKLLSSYVRKYDFKQNAKITIASNFLAWENGVNVAKEVWSGYNYYEYLYDLHHVKYPEWVIYGSETTSTVKSRGIYHFPADSQNMIYEDLQCSSLDNSSVPWGTKNLEIPLIIDRDRKWYAGQFIWCGFDYIGEPTPYKTKNSYFGVVDTSGIPKDIYYLYQSEWTNCIENPMVHLFPYWNFNKGQMIDIYAYTNASEVELFLNGNTKGRQKVDHINGNKLHGQWRLPYEPGTLKVLAYSEDNTVIASDEQKSFSDPVEIKLNPDKSELIADGKDISFIEISLVDSDGVFVANARNRIFIDVHGAGRLVGIDNGDSSDFEDFKGTSKRLFSGKAVIAIQSTFNVGKVYIHIHSIGMDDVECVLNAKNDLRKVQGNSVYKSNLYNCCTSRLNDSQYQNEIPARQIELSVTENIMVLNEKHPIAKVKAKILPENSTFHQVKWKVVNNNGYEARCVDLEVHDNEAIIKGTSDGEFRLRCICYNGEHSSPIISELEFSVLGIGLKYKNAFEYNSAYYYDDSNVSLPITEKGGIWTYYESIKVVYKNIDFGIKSAKQIKVYVGNCCLHPVTLTLNEIMENGIDEKLISEIVIEPNGKWNEFVPFEYNLSQSLSGIKSFSFYTQDRIIFGGFQFVES